MALKRKLTKAEFEALETSLKTYYKLDGETATLDAEDDEDIGALRRAKDRETQAAKEAKENAKKLKADLDDLSTRLAELGDVDAKKRGDIETLEKSYKGKMTAMEEAHKVQVGALDSYLKETLVDRAALDLATKLSTAPKLLLPHIKTRLTVDRTGDRPKTVVLDAEGKISALTIEDLEKEVVANKEFASILIGTKASGSGASNSGRDRSSGTRSTTSSVDNPLTADLTKLSGADLAATVKARIEAKRGAQQN